MKACDLITTARACRGLIDGGPRRPTCAVRSARRITRYSHSLARAAANLLIGRQHTAAWHLAYRALEHGSARNACLNKQAMQGFPHEIREFAETFVDLQKTRHQADYSFEAKYDRQDTLMTINRRENAIGQLEGANIEHRREFIAHLLFKRRSP